MSRRKIHIEKVQIRLKGNPALSPRTLAAGVGPEILRQIGEATRRETGTRRIGKLDAGTVKHSGDATAADLQKQIASRIAARLGGKKSGGDD